MPRRLVVFAFGAIFVLTLGWIVLANVLLRSSLGASLASSERVTTSWEHGWSAIPTRVHLRGLRVVVETEHARWRIDAREADITLSPLALLVGRLQAHTARMAHVALAADAVHESPAVRPPVEDAPTTLPIALVRPREEDRSSPATLTVGQVLAEDVYSVRTGPLTFAGSATVHATLRGAVTGSTQIEYLSVDSSGATVRWDGIALLAEAHGHFVLRRPPARLEPVGGSGEAPSYDGELDLDASIRKDVAAEVSPLGDIHAVLRVERGALAAGSRVSVRCADALSSTTLDGELVVAKGGGARGSISVRKVRWPPRAQREPDFVVDDAELAFASPRITLDDPLFETDLVVDVRRAYADPVRLPMLAPFVRDFESALAGTAHLVFDEPGLAEARLDIEAVSPGAKLRVHDGVADFHDRLSLRGPTTVHVDDSARVLEALTGRSDLPLVRALASTRSFDASADLYLDTERASLVDIEGSIGFIAIRGRWARDLKGPRSTTAKLLLLAGPLATGVALDGGKTTLVFADARSWFERTAP